MFNNGQSQQSQGTNEAMFGNVSNVNAHGESMQGGQFNAYANWQNQNVLHFNQNVYLADFQRARPSIERQSEAVKMLRTNQMLHYKHQMSYSELQGQQYDQKPIYFPIAHGRPAPTVDPQQLQSTSSPMPFSNPEVSKNQPVDETHGPKNSWKSDGEDDEIIEIYNNFYEEKKKGKILYETSPKMIRKRPSSTFSEYRLPSKRPTSLLQRLLESSSPVQDDKGEPSKTSFENQNLIQEDIHSPTTQVHMLTASPSPLPESSQVILDEGIEVSQDATEIETHASEPESPMPENSQISDAMETLEGPIENVEHVMADQLSLSQEVPMTPFVKQIDVDPREGPMMENSATSRTKKSSNELAVLEINSEASSSTAPRAKVQIKTEPLEEVDDYEAMNTPHEKEESQTPRAIKQEVFFNNRISVKSEPDHDETSNGSSDNFLRNEKSEDLERRKREGRKIKYEVEDFESHEKNERQESRSVFSRVKWSPIRSMSRSQVSRRHPKCVTFPNNIPLIGGGRRFGIVDDREERNVEQQKDRQKDRKRTDSRR